MHKLTVVTAALAAGVMTFAVSAAYGEPMSFRINPSPTPTISQSQKSKTTSASKAEKEPVKKAAARKKATTAKARKASAKRKAGRIKVLIDTTTTASIKSTGEGKPMDEAKPAKAVSGGARPYSAIIARYAADYGVPVSLARAVIKVESNFRPHLTGSAGEVGLMQIKPATARMLGYTGSVKALYNPETNIKYGMKYLAIAQDLGGGTTCGTILKYNAGHGAKRMNPVSSAYCSKVKIQMATAEATPA